MPPKRRGAKRKQSESLGDRDAITTQREGRAVGHRNEDSNTPEGRNGDNLARDATTTEREGRAASHQNGDSNTPEGGYGETLTRGGSAMRSGNTTANSDGRIYDHNATGGNARGVPPPF